MLVVNFATKEYRRAQQRLKISLTDCHGLYFEDYQPGWKTHKESPYEFKINAIERAMEIDPIVLWVDSSMYRVGDLSVIENIIKTDGYFMEEAGHWVRDWCKPETKEWFDLKPEELEKFNMFSAGLLGLNFNNTDAQLWFSAWKVAAQNGHFAGPWSTHRHDMTCGSIIAQRMNFKYQRGGSHLAYIGPGYSQPEKGVVFYCQGI